jgi:hypothetical protein
MPVSINGTNGLTFNDGTVQNTVGYSPWRNRIINGDMRIDQRNNGASVAITGGATTLVFGPDRWQVRSAGANASAQQVTVSSQRRLRFTGATSVTAVAAHQRIEATNSLDLAGSSVTISLKAFSTSLTSLTIELYYANSTDAFGTWGSPAVTSIGSQAVAISTTEQTISATFSVPSAATTGLEIRVTGGALLASQTLTIGDIQLEAGTTATPFERVDYSTSLIRCQRYYETVGVYVSTSAWATIVNGAGPKVTKRAIPTLTVTNFGSGSGAAFTWSPATVGEAGAGWAYQTTANSANASATLIMSIEL